MVESPLLNDATKHLVTLLCQPTNEFNVAILTPEKSRNVGSKVFRFNTFQHDLTHTYPPSLNKVAKHVQH